MYSQHEYKPCYLPPYNDNKFNTEGTENAKRIQRSINKFSEIKYSPSEWKQHNANLIEGTPIGLSNEAEANIKNCLSKVYQIADKEFNHTTDQLKTRAHEIYQWKCETEFCIKSLADEITSLEELRQRMKSAIAILEKPEAIVKECLQIRSNRLETDLVTDMPEEELLGELSLILDIRRTLNQMFIDLEEQMKNNKAIKSKVEFDWSDKVISYDTDTSNIGLNKHSSTIMMKFGSVKLTEQQPTLAYWNEFTKHNLKEAESMRQISLNLRKYIEVLLLNTSRDLRIQADRVDQALNEKANCTDEARIRIEDELKITLLKITNIENQIVELKEGIQRINLSLKVAQSRLDNRMITGRPNVENCNDPAQYGLLLEVKALSDSIHSLNEELYNANLVRSKLLKYRHDLEKDIIIKRKSINIDQNCCKIIRSFYPTASKLSGYD